MTEDIRIQETVYKINALTEQTLCSLILKWNKMYNVDDNFKTKNLEKFVSHVQDLYDNMVKSVELRMKELSEEVDSKLLEANTIKEELDVVLEEVNTSLPLQCLVTKLDNSLEELKTLRESKMQKYKSLQNQEILLCHLLGKKHKSQSDHFPKEKDFEELDLYIFELSQEKIERTEFRTEAKSRISTILSQLGLQPQSELEKELISNDDVEILDDDYISKIKELEASLNEMYDLQKKNKIFKLGALKSLWTKIKIPENEQQEFLSSLNDELTPSVFDKIDKEFSRCEAIKLENIKPIILSTKERLLELWDKMKYSEEQRKECCPFYSPIFNEDVLNLLEVQMEKLENYYKENSVIYELTEKWFHLWERMVHLEEISKNKDRLFNNRGGQLLKEEKERKAVENNLPKIFVELESILMKYMEKNGSPFLWNGQDLLLKVQDDWSKKQLAMKTKKSKAVGGGMSPVAGQKRKLPVTPVAVRKCRTPCSVKSRSRPITPISLPDDSNGSIASSYSVFQEQMESRFKTPRRVNENSPLGPLHSSPTCTPIKKLRNTPRTAAITPIKFNPTSRTPLTSSNRLPVTPSRKITGTPSSRLATPSRLPTPVSLRKLKSSSCNKRFAAKSPSAPLSQSRFTPAKTFDMII